LEEKTKKRLAFWKAIPSFSFSEEKIQKIPKISWEFSSVLKKLLTADFSKRTIFPLLIKYAENENGNQLKLQYPLLGGKHDWVIKSIDHPDKSEMAGKYHGMGKYEVKPEEKDNDPKV
jgi:hypothetical protein